MEHRKKRIIVTGANGFLGSRLVHYYGMENDVIALGHAELDITNRSAVMDTLNRIRPEAVFHCAAISDTGYSQQHPTESECINLRGTCHIAEASQSCGAKLIYMSSDQVYNGNAEQGPLSEEVGLHPVSVYGQHKLEAEHQVAQLCPTAVGLRLTWMYDLPTSTMKLNRNIFVNLLDTFQHHGTLKVAVREYRGITSVWEVVKRMEYCLSLPGGAYNFGCENELTSYDTFLEAARCMNLPHPEQWIIADIERFPEHPRNLSMSLAKLRSYHLDFPSTCEGFKLAYK